MPALHDEFLSLVKPHLTDAELAVCVAYAVENFIPAGRQLLFPGIAIDVSQEACLFFVDREPTANWGHSCRYILINRENREVRSFESRFPPFQTDDELRWLVVYKAPPVPESAVFKRQ